MCIRDSSRAVAVVYRELGEALRVANAVDFDDLLVLPVRLLAENPPELEKYRRKFRYLLVDEYQDTNRAQYQFVKLLAGGTATSAWSATTISRSTAGAVPT